MSIEHLRHMAEVRPAGLDRDAAKWALAEIEQGGPMTMISVQDPRALVESLIALGPSHDGAVERDLRYAVQRQHDLLAAKAAEIERLLAALKIAHEGLELAGDMIHDMVSRGHIIGDNCSGPGYFVGSGVLPKIAEAREAARHAHEQSQRSTED